MRAHPALRARVLTCIGRVVVAAGEVAADVDEVVEGRVIVKVCHIHKLMVLWVCLWWAWTQSWWAHTDD